MSLIVGYLLCIFLITFYVREKKIRKRIQKEYDKLNERIKSEDNQSDYDTKISEIKNKLKHYETEIKRIEEKTRRR